MRAQWADCHPTPPSVSWDKRNVVHSGGLAAIGSARAWRNDLWSRGLHLHCRKRASALSVLALGLTAEAGSTFTFPLLMAQRAA
jgi:hypothetical protein